MEITIKNKKLFKVKQSKDWTNIMVLSDDEDLSLSIKNDENERLVQKLNQSKGKIVDLKVDANQMNNGNIYFVLQDVIVSNGTGK